MEGKNVDRNDISLELLTNHRSRMKIYNDTTSQIIDETPSLLFSKRFLVAIVLFLCFMNIQMLRSNINIAVTEMVSNRSYVEGNTTVVKADFNWDTTKVGLIIGIFTYGGLFAIFADLATDEFGGSVNCSWSLLVCGILTTLHPPILYLNFYLFLACRLLSGIFETVYYMSVNDIFSRWFPKKELCALVSFSFNGTNIGLAGVYPFYAYMAQTWGWQMIFFITGFLSIISAILSMIVIKNKPSQDKWISKRELLYILRETNRNPKTSVDHPYKSILTSPPVWALCIMYFTYMWILSVFSSFLSLNIKDLTQKEADRIGYISSIPSIVYIFLYPIDGAVMDYWKNRSNLTATIIDKIIVSTAFLFASVTFVIVGASFSSNFITSVTMFVLVQIPMSFIPIIVQILIVNLGLDHCGVLSGMTSFLCTISVIVCQTVTGYMITNQSIQEWNNCFYLAAAISALGAIIFILFGSSEAQPWALTSPSKEERHL